MLLGKLRIITIYTLSLAKLTFMIFLYGFYVSSVNLRDILLIAMVVKPEWKVFGAYLGSAFINPNFEPVKVFISSVTIKDKEDSCGILHISHTKECSVLKAERIMKLQGVIIKKLYAVWFGIACSSDDLKILGSFGNTGWLTHNLLLASGIIKKNAVALNNDNRRRIQTVYRSFVSSLALYLKLEEGAHSGSVVGKNIYPLEIEIQSLKIRRENILSYEVEAVRQIKMNREYSGFRKYLKAQSLIMDGRIQDRVKTEKLINKLESFH